MKLISKYPINGFRDKYHGRVTKGRVINQYHGMIINEYLSRLCRTCQGLCSAALNSHYR